MRHGHVFAYGTLIGMGLAACCVPGIDACAAEPRRAVQPMFKGIELYSWRDPDTHGSNGHSPDKRVLVGETWRFALMPGTNRNKFVEEIVQAHDRVDTVAALKARFATLARGEQVFWLVPEDPRFALPPQAIVAELGAAAQAADIRLIIPQRATAARGVSEEGISEDAVSKIACAGNPHAETAETGIPPAALRQRARHFEDRGPVRHVLAPSEILKIGIRYRDDMRVNSVTACATLRTALRSDSGSTVGHLPWSESLPAPSIDADVTYRHGGTARWLLWPNRSVIRDARGRWWFAYGF